MVAEGRGVCRDEGRVGCRFLRVCVLQLEATKSSIKAAAATIGNLRAQIASMNSTLAALRPSVDSQVVGGEPPSVLWTLV
jgi:hypothetical protein